MYNIKPLFRWAGGKGKMLKHYEPLLPDPSSYSTYCEPFFGGGAMFAHIKKTNPNIKCVINDINSGIVRVYQFIRDDVDGFLSHLEDMDKHYIPLSIEKRKEYYYELRHLHAWNYQNLTKLHETVVFYFLLKTCFNGILQINKNTNNRFGTPAGLLNEKVSVYDRDNLLAWNKALQNCDILCGDWRNAVHGLDQSNTFFFFDPPYRESFTSYGQVFTDECQLELLDYCKEVNQQGGKILLCNRDDNDDFWKDKEGSLSVSRFPVTYTAGRRKKQSGSFVAKSATEILLYSKKSVNTLPL